VDEALRIAAVAAQKFIVLGYGAADIRSLEAFPAPSYSIRRKREAGSRKG
jgi:hypothetical protein